MIGLLTAFVGDMASMVGCILGLPKASTAITFVALGTSLPDLFASKAAAQGDPYADASVGNVTGSNSVNVFLGLGLPWMMGALKWSGDGPTADWLAKCCLKKPELLCKDFPLASAPQSHIIDGGLIVVAGSLSFSVLIFCICALICFALLAWRRAQYGGELGGPTGPKKFHACVLVGLWLVYVACGMWKNEEEASR